MYHIASNYGPDIYFLLATFTLATKQDRWIYKTGIYYLKFWVKVFKWWILMAAGDTSILDPLDPVHHEVNSMPVYSHHVYISVRSPVIEQLILEKELNGQSTQWICSSSDKGFSDVGLTPLENLFTNHVVFCYTWTGSVVRCPGSVILLRKGGKKKA